MVPVTDPEQRGHIVRQAARAFGVLHPTNTRVPFDNPVSLDRQNMRRLVDEEYVCAFKADGVRYALVLCRFRGDEVACLVDRAGTVFEVCVNAAAPHFYNTSVFDGELCECTTGNGYDFVVFNALMDKGAMLAAAPYRTRLEHIRANFSPGPVPATDRPKFRMYVYAESPRLNLVVKEHDDARNLRAMAHNVTPRYRYDGIIFTPLGRPVRTGRDEGLLKYKIGGNPIDVLCAWGLPDAPMALLVDNGGVNVPLAQVVPTVELIDTPRFQEVRADAAEYHRIFGGHQAYVVEMACTVEGGRVALRYGRLRPDKDGPNNVETVRRTVQTIEDNITSVELYELLAARRPVPGAPT